MARGRMLNTSISASKKMDEIASDTARLLATWTIAHLDLNGVFYADPAMVRSMVFPRRTDSLEAIEGYLQDMARVGLIVLFESGGEMWQYWPGFEHNQPGLRRERERSQYPMPPTCGQSADNLPPTCGQDVAEMSAEDNLTELNRIEKKVIAPPRPAASLTADSGLDEGFGAVQRLWEQSAGLLSKTNTDLLGALCDEYGAATVQEALLETVKQIDRPKIKYLEAVLQNWRDGKRDKRDVAPATPPPKVLEGGAVMMPTATRRKEYER